MGTTVNDVFFNETREETLTISSHCHWLVDSDDDGLILDGNPVQMTGFSFHLGGVFLINGPHNPPIHGENHHQFTLSMYDWPKKIGISNNHSGSQ